MSILDQYDGHSDDELDDLGWDDEDDFVAVRPAGFRAVRALVALVVLVVIGWFLYTGVRDWFEAQLDPAGEPGATVAINVPPQATTSDIAEILEREEVIPNSTFFRYYAEWKGEGNFQAGAYTMQENSSAAEAIAVLNEGPVPPVFNTFGVPEGLWLSEMLPRIADQLPTITAAELQAALDSGQIATRYRPDGVESWEGLLFPAFYEIEDDAEPVEVLLKMSEEFTRVTGELGYGAAETQLGLSAYEVIIVASMVEAEAKTDGDRPKIARVIYNRIREQMSLDIDAVCIYGSGDRQIELTTEYMTEGAGPYACRSNPLLPPTPIATPSYASLEAAINPADNPVDENGVEVPWLFYVLADEEGNHFFTNSYDEFLEQRDISREQGLF